MDCELVWRMAFTMGFLLAAVAGLAIALLCGWVSRILKDSSREFEKLTREMGRSLKTALEEDS